MKRVLFVCVHNSGRSQMAEAFAKRHSMGAVEVESAGTMPSDRVNPVVVDVMKERGVDISGSSPKPLTQEMADRADLVITMGCFLDESCPAVLVPTVDWGLDDPEGKGVDEVRVIRDQIEARVRCLLDESLR